MRKFVNKIQHISIKKMYVFMSIICIFAYGCTQIDKTPVLSESEIIEIRQGNVGRFDNLKIGLENVNKSDYTNDKGEKKRGLVAMLCLFVEGNPPQEKKFEVYAGQNVKMDKYLVYVQEIRKGLTESVILQINKVTKE